MSDVVWCELTACPFYPHKAERNALMAQTGWDPDVCLEYVLVAYNSGGAKICAAHVENVGTSCPQ